MRHRVVSKQLNRDTKHREALLKNLLRELVEHGVIKTTRAKAKVVQPVADKIVTKAKQNSVAARRSLHQLFGKRDVVNTLVDRVAPVMSDRTSGYTRITDIGVRAGDNAHMVELAWVKQPTVVGHLRSLEPQRQPEKAKASQKAKPVKKEVTAAAPKKATKAAPSKKAVEK